MKTYTGMSFQQIESPDFFVQITTKRQLYLLRNTFTQGVLFRNEKSNVNKYLLSSEQELHI